MGHRRLRRQIDRLSVHLLRLGSAPGRQVVAVWPLCGLAVAFHPLVGGWAGLSFAMAWMWWGRDRSRTLIQNCQTQWLGWSIGSLVSLIGLVPAVMMLGGPAKEGELVVAQIHAFYRLSHHQTPHLFWAAQHIAGAVTLGLLVTATALLRSTARSFDPEHLLSSCWRLICLAWIAVAINIVGLLIDLVVVHVRPATAASLLRFYWFRWADIIVPLAWVAGLWSAGIALQRNSLARQSVPWHTVGLLVILSCSLTLLAVGYHRVHELLATSVAPADRTLLMSESPKLASSPEVVEEWLQVCAWVRENTPKDALFLTRGRSKPLSGMPSGLRWSPLRMCRKIVSRSSSGIIASGSVRRRAIKNFSRWVGRLSKSCDSINATILTTSWLIAAFKPNRHC